MKKKERITLLRDYSRSSERAEKMLKNKKIKYISVFCPFSEQTRTMIIDRHAVYFGLNGVTDYLRVNK